MKKSITILAAVICFSTILNAQTPDNFWSPVKESSIQVKGTRQIVPQKYLTVKLNGSDLKTLLFSAPLEKNVRINESTCIITLPLPNGTFQKFRVVESPVMEAALAASHPDIKTFSVKGIDDAYANGKLDWNEFGFHGMVRTTAGDFFIDPYCVSNTSDYITYYTADFVKDPANQAPEGSVIVNDKNQKTPAPQKKNGTGGNANSRTAIAAVCVGDHLRTYRLAVACTGEYAVAATGLAAPTVAQTLARIVTSVNRVDGVYETEVAVRLVLVATETLIVYPDPNTDPFSGNDVQATLINESQTIITNQIGSANFDIGHTFSTGGGGLANLGCVCITSSKASGITGNPSPVGDPYDIDYVAHEMGHQFGGAHTFNATTVSCGMGNRNAATAVEPGSGVTIMAYAGICGGGDNIATHSIAYFHAISYDQIVNYTTNSAGSTCPVTTTNGNQPPVVTGSGDYTIPKSTAFSLTGSATDPDGDALTFSWEETDAGTVSGTWNQGTRPYFRSYAPTASPTRIFPSINVLASGNYTITRGEFVPATAQTLEFRLTARDNKMGGGGVCYAINHIEIDASGPMAITYPNATGITWGSGTQQTIQWDVNGTDQGNVGCTDVMVSISYNGGNNFTVLIPSTPNDGSEMITVPTVTANIASCRIKIESIGNIFYDISHKNFAISTNTTVVDPVGISQISQNNPVGLSVWPNPFNDQFSFAVANLNSASVTQLTVVDVLGKIVLQNNYTAKSELKETINLSSVSAGIYFIKVSNNNKQSAYRIIKN